jgi:hypothetical protein
MKTLKNRALYDSKIRDSILEQLPREVKEWAESLPWEQRRFILSFSLILCGSSPEKQAEFLDDYFADGLAFKMLQEIDTIKRVNIYLKEFRTGTKINEILLRNYIRQYYIHCAQDVRRQPDEYLESALKLVLNTEEKHHIFHYIVGFELLKIMFKMSWLQHEKLASLQSNQENFIKNYIKPIQHAHQVNGLIVPKDKRIFFARRDYYISIPEISGRKLRELVMVTFTADKASESGFSVIRHLNSLRFDYDYIFKNQEPEMESLLNP